MLLDLICRAAEQSYQTAAPSYLAYIPGGGIFTSALAGFLGWVVILLRTNELDPISAFLADVNLFFGTARKTVC